MKKPFFICILSVLIIDTYAQESFKISRPDLQFMNEILTIRYDITGCPTGELIDIELVVLNSKGDTLRPVSVTGDFGPNVTCDTGKIISWYVIKDNISINDELDIQVRGERITASPAAPDILSQTKRRGKGNMIISSVFVPGLGQMKATGKPSYLIFSGLVYGASAASAYYTLRSRTAKDDYLSAVGAERDDFYSEWEKDYNMSKYLAIGAAGAWVINIIWTATMPAPNSNQGRMKLSFANTGNREFLISAKLNF